MPSVDFAANNPAYLNAFGQVVNYQQLGGASFDCLAIESRPRNLEWLADNRPSYWFSLPDDLTTAVIGQDLQVLPSKADLAVIKNVNYIVVNVHGDGAGGVYLTFELE